MDTFTLKLEFHGINDISLCEKDKLISFINENILFESYDRAQQQLDSFCRNRDYTCEVQNDGHIKIYKEK